MILGVGVDIEKISRFRKVSENFLKLVFSKKEIQYCKNKKEPFISFAGKFCAKEAVIKAYPNKIPLKDIEILNGEGGKPKVYIRGKLKKKIYCSISHTTQNTIAYVVIEN